MKTTNEYQPNENGSLKHIKEWTLTNWGEKSIFVIGCLTLAWIIAAIIYSLISSAVISSSGVVN